MEREQAADKAATDERASPYEFSNPVACYLHERKVFIDTTRQIWILNRLLRSLAMTNDGSVNLSGELSGLRRAHTDLEDMVAGWWNYGRDAERAAEYFNDYAEQLFPILCDRLRSKNSAQADKVAVCASPRNESFSPIRRP